MRSSIHLDLLSNSNLAHVINSLEIICAILNVLAISLLIINRNCQKLKPNLVPSNSKKHFFSLSFILDHYFTKHDPVTNDDY
jgi:hypothetical protein